MSRTVYDSSHTYDFQGALDGPSERKRTTPERIGKSVGRASGKVAGEYARTFWASRYRAELDGVELASPTRDQLVRHVEKFGPDEVEEVALAYGIDLDVKTRRPTVRDQRRASGLALLEEGKTPEEVARTKSVSADTVRRWQRETEALPKSVSAVRSRGQRHRLDKPQKVQR